MEDTLIGDIVKRLAQELPFYNVNKRGQGPQFWDQNCAALLCLSSNKISNVAQSIYLQLVELEKLPLNSEENILRVAQSQLKLLELLENALKVPWDHVKQGCTQDNELETYAEKLNFHMAHESLLPPALPAELATDLFQFFADMYHKPHAKLNKELQEASSKCLFQLSASNYSDIVKQIIPVLNQTSLSEEDLQLHISLLEHLNHSEKSLGMMLQMIGKVIPAIKKTNVQIAMANIIRTIIWSWIDNFPWQFIGLCQSGKRLPGNPDIVFDVFDSWASNTAKKANFWPVCTMLLILCPDILLSVVNASKEKSKELANKAKFIEGLRAGLKASKLSDVAVRCFVDFCKASTFVSKSDISALRYIPPSVDVQLVEKLFKTPIKSADGSVDKQLMVDGLKSFFYLSPRKMINSLFSEFVGQGSSPLQKQVFVSTLLEIVSEKKVLEWNPTLADIYQAHASTIRSMFEDLLSSTRGYEAAKQLTDKKGKAHFEKILCDIEILKEVITLYGADPKLALYLKEEKQSEEVKRVLTGLSDCCIFWDLPDLAEKGADTLLTLHKAENIKEWFKGADDFWSTTSSINLILATIVIERSDLKSEYVGKSLHVLEQILKLRNEFIRLRTDIIPSSASKHIRLFSSTNLESAFLINLGSSNTQIVSQCANVCRLLCEELSILQHCIDETDNIIVHNVEAYSQLAHSSLLSTGRQAQQKAIRTILKKVDRRTPGNFVSWDEVCYRWHIYTKVVCENEEANAKKDEMRESGKEKKKNKSSALSTHDASGLHKVLIDKAPGDVLSEWSNYMGFLCSLNAVTINQSSGRAIGARATKADCSAGPETFLELLMDLLVSEYVSIREAVKMMLGNATSPSVFTLLFQTLLSQAKQRIFSEDGQADFTQNSILFADQAVSIVKLILETESDKESLSLLNGFEDLILLLIRFVRQLIISANSLQIRHKLCGLLSVMMHKSSLLHFRNAFEFRMELVGSIMEFTSEFSTKESNIPADLPPPELRQVTKLIKELDVQAMQCISLLLKGLPLQGKDDNAKSSEFSKFFNFFTKLLTRCKKTPQSVLTPQLPDATIESLSFLVTANIEHGIEYFLSMGYYEDYESRSAFLRVLTNILKEGTEFDGGEQVEKYYKLREVVLGAADSSLEVVLTLGDVTPITEADKVAQLLVRIFEANNKAVDLLKAAITAEVEKTEKANTLFRLNSMATKLLSAYCKLIGKEYLQVSVGPQIKELIQNPRPCEVDPARLPEGETIPENQANILDITQKFLTDIQASIESCPPAFREICKFLREIVTKKFPEAGNTVIAGFMFLRYLCPAIVAPDGFGVVETSIQDPSIRRGFVLLTKVLQNLANRVLFTKEVFMQPYNEFIERNIPIIESIFATFATSLDVDTSDSHMNFTEEQVEEDMGRLHFYLAESLDKLGKAWSDTPASLDRLTAILAQLGPPPELPKASKVFTRTLKQKGNKKANVQYEKFMNRMANENTDSVKERGVFYSSGVCAKGNPVLYYIARNWSSSLDMDLFNYYLIKTLQPFAEKAYSIVIDVTHFSAGHQPPPLWSSSLYTVLPPSFTTHLDTIYLLHVNPYFKKYAKRVGKMMSRVTKKMLFCSSSSQLAPFIPELSLPKETLDIEKSVQASFSKVVITKMGGHISNKKEVKFIICSELLQIQHTKPIPILDHNVQIVELIPVGRITNISAKEKNEFLLSYNICGAHSATVSSSSSDQIIQQLTALKDRYGLSEESYARAKTFQPENVPGTLLNMAFLNLSVNNYSLRVSAYNLLATLCSTFAYKIESNLLESYDIAIPHNCKHFVVRVSEDIARSETKMTLEFLQQAIEAISNGDKSSRVLVLDYIRPWLFNVETIPKTPENLSKIRDIMNLLVVLSIREGKDIGPTILSKVWSVLGQCPSMLSIIINCLLDRTNSSSGISQLGEKAMDCAENIIVSLAMEDSTAISGEIIKRFIEILDDNKEGVARLESKKGWIRCEVLIRFLLTLSFENLLSTHIYLPEIFHIIICAFYTGDGLIRANVYTLFLNTVHTLLCSTGIVMPEKVQTLQFLYSDFQSLPHRVHFGVGGNTNHFSPYQQRADRDNRCEIMPISAPESVATALWAVLNCCSTNVLESEFHKRWLSLTLDNALTSGPCTQPRTISTIGIICRDPSLVTEDLITNLLLLLKKSLLDETVSVDYPISIFNCLGHCFEYLDPESQFYDYFFWIGMTVCQIQEPKLFAAAAKFLQSVVVNLYRNGRFEGCGISGYCLQTRKKLKTSLRKIDAASGLNFEKNFSFAVAGHLLKGLRNNTTKAATIRLLTDIMDSHAESDSSKILGYLAALLPLSGDDLSSNLRQFLSQTSGEGTQSLFNAIIIPDETQCALLFSFWATLLKKSMDASEQLFIYRAFEEGINFMPTIFPITFGVLTRKMEQVISSSQNRDMMSSVLAIMSSIYQHRLDSTNAQPAATLMKYTSNVGFSGLSAAHSFRANNTILPLFIKLIDVVITATNVTPVTKPPPPAVRASSKSKISSGAAKIPPPMKTWTPTTPKECAPLAPKEAAPLAPQSPRKSRTRCVTTPPNSPRKPQKSPRKPRTPRDTV